MHFYQWDQNNSGGSFDVNDKLCHRVVIEADTYKEAEKKALDMGIYYNGVILGLDCGCCGDRWDSGYEVNLTHGKFKTIEKKLQWQADEYGWTNPDIRLFYKDGSVKEFYVTPYYRQLYTKGKK